MRRLFALLVLLYMIMVCALPFSCKKSGVDGKAACFKCDGSIIYLDNEAIALSESSNNNAALRSEALEVCTLVNSERLNNGLEALDWNQNLESTSNVRSYEASIDFSHTRPNGTPWYTVNSQIQGGENLAFGYDTAEEVMDGWMNSPTHKDNILHNEFNAISVSVYQDDNGVLYWAQEFGY